MAFTSSTIFTGPFDAVLPLHLKHIFSFTALTSGAIFATLAVPEMILGPVSGWLVDRYGSKLVALIGFLTLCPGLFLLTIPTGPATTTQILSLIAILTFNGCATSMIGAPAMTEITLQLRTDGGDLDGNGYAQGYGWFNVAYSSGMLFGPLIAAWIVETWSWTVLCFVMGTAAGFTIIPIFWFTGDDSCGTTKIDSDDTE
jgi:MFS family permease